MTDRNRGALAVGIARSMAGWVAEHSSIEFAYSAMGQLEQLAMNEIELNMKGITHEELDTSEHYSHHFPFGGEFPGGR